MPGSARTGREGAADGGGGLAGERVPGREGREGIPAGSSTSLGMKGTKGMWELETPWKWEVALWKGRSRTHAKELGLSLAVP